ncbi:MAG TPA: sugar nucleotide-binding protein [Pirellulaceae bacterium]|nr:sugar nucleotide-binding protein [Pirellulaceae bacterium]
MTAGSDGAEAEFGGSASSAALPLLVTGVAGVPGYNAFRYFADRHPGQVVGLRREKNWPLSGDGIVGVDLEDRDAVARLFERHRFGAVLDAEGTCALKSCELDPKMAWRANVLGAKNVAELAREFGCRLVRLSIDLVFAGREGGAYVETDSVDPVTVYGKTMAESETVVAEIDPQVCLLRISLPMGVSFNGHAGAIDWIQSRFKKGRPATLYYDEIRTPTYVDCMNGLYRRLLFGEPLPGLYHAGGPRRLSLYQIAQIVNRIGGYDPDLLMGCLRHEAGPVPPRAGDVGLDSSKLKQALGSDPFDAWPFFDRHVPTDRSWHFERPAEESPSPRLLAEVLYRNPNPDRSFPLPPVRPQSAREKA